jgi:hypothetical protein
MTDPVGHNEHVTRITVAIDVDGVICPLVDSLDPLRHERETGWAYTALPTVMFGSVIADPVVQTLFDLGGASAGGRDGSDGDAEGCDEVPMQVLWHTSWWLEAPESLAPALGLTHLAGGPERMFATDDEYHGRTTAEPPAPHRHAGGSSLSLSAGCPSTRSARLVATSC